MGKSEIQWTEYTWNPTIGCNKISQGCKFCYAEIMHRRLQAMGNKKYKDHDFLDGAIPHYDSLEIPLHLSKPRTIFVNSMSDLFHHNLPDDFISQAFSIMNIAGQHIFQVLTKRPVRMRMFLKEYYKDGDCINTIYANKQKTSRIPIGNIWLGVSIENQQAVVDRIGILNDTPAKIRWLSCEPLLEDIDLTGWLNGINWVVVGCESGPKRRECKLEWIENIVQQCKTANVPVFVKQIQLNGKVLKDIEEFPEHLRIREYPV